MKRDCPHCHKSMGGRFVRWSKVANVDRARNCPLCGGNIQFHIYPEELGARILTLVVVVVAAYWAKEHRAGYLQILVTMTTILVIIYVAVMLRLKNRQRFEKARL
jgi:uncharacterized protein (DUF983 family)